MVDGANTSVLAISGKAGSVCVGTEAGSTENDAIFRPGAGRPGVWLKRVVDGKVVTHVVRESAPLTDVCVSAVAIDQDPACDACRARNPPSAGADPKYQE